MNKYIGSSFDEFLKEESLLEDSTGVAVKRALAWQIERGSEMQGLTNSATNKKTKVSLTTQKSKGIRNPWFPYSPIALLPTAFVLPPPVLITGNYD